MNQTLAVRFAGAVLTVCLVSACAGIGRARPAPQSTNARLETSSHSTLESTTSYKAFQSDSIVNAQIEMDTGPKTERVVGVVAAVTAVSAFAFFIIVVYRVVQLLSN